jgi:L-amino acid N-acyltransferase
MELIIRHATEQDLPGILYIYNDAILNTTAVYDYKAHTMEMREKWFQDKKQNNFPVLVAANNDTVAGFASYGPFRAWAAYKYSIEHSVYVHPDFRRRGIAKKLLQRLIDEAKQKEIHTMIAGIDANNTISLELHKQLGFEQTANMKQVGYKFGKWLDLIFMQLILDNPLEPREV